jgi:phosphohistidine phosphatase
MSPPFAFGKRRPGVSDCVETMNLYILRHGVAVEPGTPGFARDADRILTPEGEGKLRKIAKAMEAMELEFDLILSSPYLRAKQTAQIIAKAFGERRQVELTDALIPGGSIRKLFNLIHQVDPAPSNILLVGHEPSLSDLISLLVSGGHGVPVVMKKGGLCKLSCDKLSAGRCATLQWLLTPKQMALMA